MEELDCLLHNVAAPPVVKKIDSSSKRASLAIEMIAQFVRELVVLQIDELALFVDALRSAPPQT